VDIGLGNALISTDAFSGERRAEQVLFVTPEMAGFLKAGGLGEISAYLPRMLRLNGVDTRILLPGYPAALTSAGSLTVVADLPGANAIPPCQIAEHRMADGLVVYIILCPDLYDREGSPYVDRNAREYADNDLRFARLGLAAAQIAAGGHGLGWVPDLVHANDWPASLAPAYMEWSGVRKPSILTVHNLAYQGVFECGRAAALGIPGSALGVKGVEFYGNVSFLKAGLFYATHVTTVSPTYAREILMPELGCGLDGLLRDRAEHGELTGILNGIDESYDPGSDPHLVHHFGCGDMSGKDGNAADVRQTFSLSESAGPLFALVSRLVHQKGVDLVVDAARAILEQGGQIVATGKGEPHLEQAMISLSKQFPGAVGVRIGFEESLARRMYAGSDFLLMPSRFEPCGLSQMYAQRFGCLPIARKTGGLTDTVQDNITGFLFDAPSVSALTDAIDRAFQAFRSSAILGAMKTAAMLRPAGWNAAATSYQNVYDGAMQSALG
jgi:starch synthase